MKRKQTWPGWLVVVSLLMLLVPLPVWADDDSDSDSDDDGLPGTIDATFSGSATLAGVDLNGDGILGASHGQGVGRGTLGKFAWDSLSEPDPNFIPDTERCPSLLEVQFDAFSVVLRHNAGDLLYLRLEPGDEGYGCLDPVTFTNSGVADLTILGGTGRFAQTAGSARVELVIETLLRSGAGGFAFGGGVGTLVIDFD